MFSVMVQVTHVTFHVYLRFAACIISCVVHARVVFVISGCSLPFSFMLVLLSVYS